MSNNILDTKKPFIPGETYIPSSGKVHDTKEKTNLIKAVMDEVWTEGTFNAQFLKDFKEFLGVRSARTVNSGSSANLVAFAALTSPTLGDRMIKRGDEFITTPVGFPTTVNPAISYGLKPVYVEFDPRTLNINVDLIEEAITEKTKLIMVAHTLGVPFDIDRVVEIAKKHNLWVVEDCCDALGSKLNGRHVGTLGDAATYSFYPAHQMTMGEGGAVTTNNLKMGVLHESFRSWGKGCWCAPGHDDTCGKRFAWKEGGLPEGYDHKFIFSELGYNLKITDFQAAIGCAQIKKLPFFIEHRKLTYAKYKALLASEHFDFPELIPGADPCWFGFPIMVKDGAPFTKQELVRYLEGKKIGTRNVFAGNLIKQPAYYNKVDYRSVGSMDTADYMMNSAFWIGVFPGITDEMSTYVAEQFLKFLEGK